jgi:glutamyl-Q tRNA(Asp) synthetase
VTRSVPGADREIIAELHRLGLEPDGEVTWQQDRNARYDQAIDEIERGGGCFPCGCTRKEVGGGQYPGTCRNGLPTGRLPRSLRLRVRPEPEIIEDRAHGAVHLDVAAHPGDFVIRRADKLVAYHLATVVDDHDAGITDVVRGEDLLDSCGPQRAVGRYLGLSAPRYLHLPVRLDADGNKLSKQNHAPPTSAENAVTLWHETLTFLGMSPPAWNRATPLAQVRNWASERWLGACQTWSHAQHKSLR